MPKYLLLVVLGIVFGAFNFTLLIPLLDVLFNNIDTLPVKPEAGFSLLTIKDHFYYRMEILAAQDKGSALLFICAVILGCTLLANLFRWLSQSVLTKMRTTVVYRLRKEIFGKYSSFDLGFYGSQKKGDLISVVSGDVQEIESSVVSSVQVIFREPLIIIVYFIILFVISVKLTLFTLILLPVSGIIITGISRRLRKQADEGQRLLGSILSVTEELISGLRVVKAFNAERFVREKFDAENDAYRKVSASIVNKRELASPVSEFLGVAVVVGVILYGGKLVFQADRELEPSAFIAYLVFYSQILSPAKNISSAITSVQRGLAASRRVINILDEQEEIKDLPDAKPVKEFTSEIAFRNVSFSYLKDGGYALRSINFSIPAGKTIALVGQSGSGKTTLADLLPRFYDPTQGEVLLDGNDIRMLRLHDLRNLIGFVSQESILFNDTIFNNIAFARENTTEAEVIHAAKVANAHEFIVALPNGYQTNIGDRGSKLSGGQRQRLSIARAVLKNPPILILDEATSALDTESERLVQDALNRLMKNRTSVIIAHRLSTIQHADEIIVLHEGILVERGSHTQLLATGSYYKKLYEMQAFQ